MRIVKDTYDLLFPDQKTGVEFLYKNRSALLADEFGTGKTAQAIHACIAVGARTILVICTASIKYNWRKEAIKWGFDERDIHILNDKNINALPQERGMFIINYENIWRKRYVKVLAKRRYDVLIADECHRVKNPKAKCSKAVWLRNGYCDLSDHRWMLSASPVLNRPVELHSMLKKLCPERLGGYINYIDYTKRYCEGKDSKWGWDANGACNLEELAGRLEGFMLRRLRKLPMGKMLQKIYLPIDSDKLYLSEDESVRRTLGKLKVEPSVDHIENILESEDKVLVFAYHHDVIHALTEKLKKYNPAVIYGETPVKDRQGLVERFGNDKDTRVFIGQITAVGEGVDGLQNSCSVGVFVEICHTPGVINQAIGRLYRTGQKRDCVFQFLLVADSIDEQILDSTILKEHNIKEILKDENIGLDFKKVSTTKGGSEMSIEQSLDRIAKSLETLVDVLAEVGKGQPTVTSNECVAADTIAEPVEQPKKKRTKKTETPKVETVKGVTPEQYKQKMHDAANLISGFATDAKKKSEMFAELQSRFKAQYPTRLHVFDVEPKDQEDVVELVDEYLKEKGVI